MYFDRLDIIEAYFTFLTEYHEGQFSDKYKRLCKIMTYYNPSPLYKGFGCLSDNGKEIYRQLVRNEENKPGFDPSNWLER